MLATMLMAVAIVDVRSAVVIIVVVTVWLRAAMIVPMATATMLCRAHRLAFAAAGGVGGADHPRAACSEWLRTSSSSRTT